MLQSSQVFFPSSPLKKPVAAAQPTSTSPRVTKGSQKPFNHKEVLDHMEKGGLFNGSGLIVSLFLHLTGFELGWTRDNINCTSCCIPELLQLSRKPKEPLKLDEAEFTTLTNMASQSVRNLRISWATCGWLLWRVVCSVLFFYDPQSLTVRAYPGRYKSKYCIYLEFTPFDWEDFWASRKKSEI